MRSPCASRSCRRRGIDLRVELADRLPLVYIDHARLEDVLVNLIQNAEAAIARTARRHSRSRRRAGAGPRRDHDRRRGWQGDPDRILVEVADNGSGLQGRGPAARLRSVLHDPRSRAGHRPWPLGVLRHRPRARRPDHRPQRRGRRRGLHDRAAGDGRIAGVGDARPRPAPRRRRGEPAGAGAVVRHGRRRRRTRSIAPPRRRKALVVDDEESNAALVRRVLAGAGYDVESTTLSRRALVMIERTAYDAVICDVKMPELSGQELYGRVCQIRPEMARRFIFITGDIDGEDTREFLDESRCSYFMKPFNLERLTAAVDMLTGSDCALRIRSDKTMDKIVDFINVNRDRYIDEMKRYLAIPSISALPEHKGDVRACAEWTADEMRRIGLQNVPARRDAGPSRRLRRVARRARRADDPVLRPLRRAAGRPGQPVDVAAVRGDHPRRRDLRARLGRRQGPGLHALQGRRGAPEAERQPAGEHEVPDRGRRGSRQRQPRQLHQARTRTCSRPTSSSSPTRRCSIAASRRSATACAA